MKKVLTLCMVCEEDRVLLGMKKRGFGEGRWNGFGGKVEEGETIESAAVRELKEEAGLEPVDMKKAGILEFSFQDDPKLLEVHIFRITAFAGEPVESEEMRPKWFKLGEIPFRQMWSDDEHWFPYLLGGKLFKGSFLFDKPATAAHPGKIIAKELAEADVI